MINNVFIFDEIVEKSVKNLSANNNVLLIGASKTGKSEILKQVAQNYLKLGAPFYLINCPINSSCETDNSALYDALVLSTFYNGNKVEFNSCGNTQDDFYTVARNLIKYITSGNESRGLIIIDNYENLGPYFLQRFTQIFWNIDKINILASFNPVKNRIINREELSGFKKIEIDIDTLHKNLIENKNGIFLNSGLNDEEQNLVIAKSNNFESLAFIAENLKNRSLGPDFETDKYFNRLLSEKTDSAVTLLKSSAAIGEIFEKKLLNYPLKIANVTDEIANLLLSGEIYPFGLNNEKYKFTYERFFEYLLQNIEREKFINWSNLLGDFFYEEAIKAKRVFDNVYVALMRKSFRYYINGIQLEKACILALKLINYYHKANEYDELISLSEELINADIVSEIKLYILNVLIDMCNELSLYNKSKYYIDSANVINAESDISYYNFLYTQIQSAEYYYYYSGEKRALEILTKLFENKKLNDFPNIKYRANALMSSVLYNSEDNHQNGVSPTTFYNDALNYGQVLKDVRYYKLLQKSVLFYLGNATSLTRDSYAYFEVTDNKAELARSKNNLGVCLFEQGDYAEAESNCEESKRLLDECLANNLISHPLNNIAAAKMLTDDYDGAIENLLQALNYSNGEEFTEITIYFNLAACYYKKNIEDISGHYLSKALNLINNSKEGESHFYELFINTHYALYYSNKNLTEECLGCLNNIKSSHLFYKQMVSEIKGEKRYKQYKLKYLNEVLKYKVCPHYLVFE